MSQRVRVTRVLSGGMAGTQRQTRVMEIPAGGEVPVGAEIVDASTPVTGWVRAEDAGAPDINPESADLARVTEE